MNRSRYLRLVGAFVGLAVVLGASEALAVSPRQFLRPPPGPGMSMPNFSAPQQFGPNQRMPGWDWQRTYPWSPYNYGRNPYNPGILPYPPVYPPYYPPVGGPTYGSPSANYQQLPGGSVVPQNQAPPVMLPHPTGELRAAPPDAGVIEVRIPDQFATVLFDGTKTISTGTTRYYVTPPLPGGKPMSYTISATWKQFGQPMSAQQTVQVNAGHFSVVDFNDPPQKK